MKNRNEFFEYVKENIKDYLPPSLREAQLSIHEWVRENDWKLHVLTIRRTEEDPFPNICLDGFYQCYQEGKELDACVGDVADMYIAYGGMEDAKEPGIIWDYEKVKNHLFIRLCDLQWSQGYLKDKIYTVHGDFAAAYYVAMYEDMEKTVKAPVTELLIKTWGISMEQLYRDVLLAERLRQPALTDLNVLICSETIGIGKTENLLTEGAVYHSMGIPMLCLTNRRKQFGASLILHDDILRRAGEVLGSNYFVLPSSIHETILVPDIGGSDAQGLCLMVKYLDYWMQNIYLPFCNSSAKAGYAWTIYQIIYPRVKRDILLGMITGKFLNELLEQCVDYCECAAPMVYRVLYLALQDAIDDGYIRNNPLPEMKRYEWKAPQITILTNEQLKVFLSAAKEYHSIYLEVLLALFCGLRKGEILGLKISDFDESAQTVDIDRQITRDYDIVIRDNHTYKIQSQKMSVKPPKSLSSYRTLKISSFIFKELACRIAENKEILAECNEKQWSEYICLGVKGNIKCESTFWGGFKADMYPQRASTHYNAGLAPYVCNHIDRAERTA